MWSKYESCAIKIKKVIQALVIPPVMFEVTLQRFFFKIRASFKTCRMTEN